MFREAFKGYEDRQRVNGNAAQALPVGHLGGDALARVGRPDDPAAQANQPHGGMALAQPALQVQPVGMILGGGAAAAFMPGVPVANPANHDWAAGFMDAMGGDPPPAPPAAAQGFPAGMPYLGAHAFGKPPDYWVQRTVNQGKIPHAPAMYVEEAPGKYVRMDPGSLPQWLNQLETWFGSVSLSGLSHLSELLIKLDPTERVLPIEGHDLSEVITNTPLQRIILQGLSSVSLTLSMPSPEVIARLPQEVINHQFRGFLGALQKLWFELDASSRTPKELKSVFPDIFNVQHGEGVQLQKLGINLLVAIARIRRKLESDPSGSAFEMAKILHAYIESRHNAPGFGVHQLVIYLDEIIKQFYAIVQKEPQYEWTLNHQTQLLCNQLVVAACNQSNQIRLSSTKLQYACERIKADLLAAPSGKAISDFTDFTCTIRRLLTAYLPSAEDRTTTEDTLPAGSKRARTESTDLAALQAVQTLVKAGHIGPAQMGKIFAGIASGSKFTSSASGSGSPRKFKVTVSGPPPPANKRPRTATSGKVVSDTWMCEKCTQLGHHHTACPNEAHPDAAKIVEQHKKQKHELTKKRKMREVAQQHNAKSGKHSSKSSSSQHSREKAFAAAFGDQADEDDEDDSSDEDTYKGHFCVLRNTTSVFGVPTDLSDLLSFPSALHTGISDLWALSSSSITAFSASMPDFSLPFVIALYALALSVVAHKVNFRLMLMLTVSTFIWTSALALPGIMSSALSVVTTHFRGEQIPRAALTTVAFCVTLFSLFGPSSAQLALLKIHHACQATEDQLQHNVYIDSGCSKSVYKDEKLLVNVRKLSRPARIHGVGGYIHAHNIGDYPLVLQEPGGECHLLLIKGVLLAKKSAANLLSTNELTAAGATIKFPANKTAADKEAVPTKPTYADDDQSDEAVKERVDIRFPTRHPLPKCTITITSRQGRKIKFQLTQHMGIWPVPSRKYINGYAEINGRDMQRMIKAYHADAGTIPPTEHFLFNTRMLTDAELWHLRMGHAHITKLAKLSRNCIGINRHIAESRHPCHDCQDCNVIRNNAPPPSQHQNKGAWNVDMIDMGEKNLSMSGYRYITIFTIADSRYLMIFLHKTKDEFPSLLKQAFARAGCTPRILRTDGATEYHTPEVQDILLKHQIKKETSNAEEQFGNAKAETIVRALGKGIRVALYSANVPLEFWGYAAINWVDIYNHLPHASLDWKTPWEAHHGTKPDVSWFKPFGCRVTVFRGREKVAHHKLSPRGLAGIYLGLGFHSGQKGWLCWVPDKSKPNKGQLFCTRHCVFDETFMPMRTVDQRILGFLDPTPRRRMQADFFGNPDVAQSVADELQQSGDLLWDPESVETMDDSRHSMPFVHQECEEFLDLQEGDSPPPKRAKPSGGDTAIAASGGVNDTERNRSAVKASGGSVPHTVAKGPAARPSGGTSSHKARHSSDGANSGVDPGMPSAGGKQPAHGTVDDSTPTNNYKLRPGFNWKTLGPEKLNAVTPFELTEWLIGHSITLRFSSGFFPHATTPGPWNGFAHNTTKQSVPRAMCEIEPYREAVLISIVPPTSDPKRLTIVDAVRDTYPLAHTCQDLLKSYVGLGHEPCQAEDPVTEEPADSEADTVNEESDEHPLASASREVETQRERAKRARYTARRAALSATSFMTFVLQAFTPASPQIATPRNKLTMDNSAPGATFAAYTATNMTCAMADTFAYTSAFLPPEPKSQKDARQRPDSDKWLKAEDKEIATLNEMNTFEVVDKPTDVYDPLPLRFVYKLKIEDGNFDKAVHKARLVMRGNLQYESEYGETYAPTAKLWTIRTLVALAAQEGLQMKKFDLTGAFLVADMDRSLFVEIPGYDLPAGKALRLKKALYGGRSSGALYAKEISTWLKDYGFKPTSVDETLFRLQRGSEIILLSLYVDDGACATNSTSLYKQFIKDLQSKYKLSDQGDLKWHLGMKFTFDKMKGTITMDQRAYIENVLKRFKMEKCTAKPTPLVPHIHLSKHDCPKTVNKEDLKFFQQLIGSLMYIACGTRPDIAYAVNTCAQFMSNPGPSHIAAAKHILRYLKGTSDVGLTYSKQPKELANQLYGFVDADHASDSDDRKSVGGYVLMLGGAAISWSSRKIKVVAISSFESEWYSASICGCEVTVIRRLLEEIGFPQAKPTKVFEDNAACIYSSMDSKPMNPRSKHIDTRVFKLKEFVKDGILTLVKVESERQVADNMTKPLHKPGVTFARDVMSGAEAFRRFTSSS
jgi:hypothetical protein